MSTIAEDGDRIERETRPGFWTSAFWPMLGGQAPQCAAGDRRTARLFLARIEAAIDRGGWTRNEWRRLHKLYEVWSRRANGQDPRFEVVGVRAGRLERHIEAHIRQRRSDIAVSEWARVVQPLRTVNAADPRTRPSASTLKARALRRKRQYSSE